MCYREHSTIQNIQHNCGTFQIQQDNRKEKLYRTNLYRDEKQMMHFADLAATYSPVP